MKFETLKKELLKDKNFRKEYERTDDLSLEISEMIINARVQKGMTQAELAKILKTKQSSIARAENGNTLPSISFLQKIAKALGVALVAPKLDLGNGSYTGTEKFKNKIFNDNPVSLNIYKWTSNSANGRLENKWDLKIENINQ